MAINLEERLAPLRASLRTLSPTELNQAAARFHPVIPLSTKGEALIELLAKLELMAQMYKSVRQSLPYVPVETLHLAVCEGSKALLRGSEERAYEIVDAVQRINGTVPAGLN